MQYAILLYILIIFLVHIYVLSSSCYIRNLVTILVIFKYTGFEINSLKQYATKVAFVA